MPHASITTFYRYTVRFTDGRTFRERGSYIGRKPAQPRTLLRWMQRTARRHGLRVRYSNIEIIGAL